ncbi:predicted protein [Streptomyces sp. C]|nr:predicted protein [Streptomyces sp. C]
MVWLRCSTRSADSSDASERSQGADGGHRPPRSRPGLDPVEITPRPGAARRDARWSTFARQYLPHPSHPLTVPVTFTYRSDDPLCVKAVFHCRQDIIWVLGRDLLAAATRSLVGSSDVVGWPDPVDGGRLWLRLGPHPDHALLSLDRTQLIAWLQITYTLVPPGTEEEHMDWTPIHRLLAAR